jgi:hypothetical protein
MKMVSKCKWALGCLFVCSLLAASAKSNKAEAAQGRIGTEIQYQGACDASAAAALDTNLVVVASDEDSRLRVYDRDRGGPPVQVFDLVPHLRLGRGSSETDLEGAARVGDRIYWVTSHARNKDGEMRPNRHRFFAVDFRQSNGRLEMVVSGQPYAGLASDLANTPHLRQFDFAGAARRQPKAPGALNIEGLCANGAGQLLIGFRNPVPGGQALLIPLTNPDQVIAGQRAKFGEPILLDLDGLGIRDIVFYQDKYIVVAGPFDGGGREKLFSWSGSATRPKLFKQVKLKQLNPEAVAVYPDKALSEFQLFCDDSSQRIGKKDCADLKDPMAKLFRSVWIELESE